MKSYEGSGGKFPRTFKLSTQRKYELHPLAVLISEKKHTAPLSRMFDGAQIWFGRGESRNLPVLMETET